MAPKHESLTQRRSPPTGRRPRSDRLSRYQLRVNFAEVNELLNAQERMAGTQVDAFAKIGLPRDAAIPDLPDVLPFLLRSWPKFILTRVQEMIWTLRNLRGRLIGEANDHARLAPASNNTNADVAPTSAPVPTLYVDITATHRATAPGGIKRVCMRIASELQASPIACPVALVGGLLRRLGGDGTAGTAVTLTPRDTYLILDFFWEPYDEYLESLRRARRLGARTVLCIYDVIPILYPGLLTKEWAEDFDQQLRAMLPLVDTIVSISKASARDIRRVVRRYGMQHKIVWFHLGSDTFVAAAAVSPMSSLREAPQFISVGTLEPKKGYDCALDAFDLLWAAGIDAHYVIVGRRGWLCEALVRRIETHAEYGTRLFWMNDASDAALEAALAKSHCSIQASVAEGFGLPIVEAAHAGLPVIASDLAVFREIAGDSIAYFPVCDASALAALIEKAIHQRPEKPKIASLSWGQSANALLNALGLQDGPG